jgi:hypothetical protein
MSAGYAVRPLSTFREPPWNMPFDATLGFAEVPDAEWSPAMRQVAVDEMRRGLDPSRRVMIRCWLGDLNAA